VLVLSRKENQQIVLSELDISIKVLRVRGSQVRLGIVAPEDIRILRGELNRLPAAGQNQSERVEIDAAV